MSSEKLAYSEAFGGGVLMGIVIIAESHTIQLVNVHKTFLLHVKKNILKKLKKEEKGIDTHEVYAY